MGSEVINIRTLVHHIEHFMLYSLILWQIVLGLWLILKWTNKNWKSKTVIHQSPLSTSQPIINIDGAAVGKVDNKKKDLSAVDVAYKKNILIQRPEDSKIRSEVKKGKVKTQKSKLKKFRGK